MTKSDKIKVDKLMHKLSLKYNMPVKKIKAIVESPHLFTKETMIEMDLSNIKSKEDFDKIKTNFGYKGLGLLYIDYKIVKKRIIQKENINNINNKRWKN